MEPKLSVIIPVFNGDRYIGRCIDFVLNQSLKDIQVIVVNDGSSDCTAQIVQKYIAETNRVKLLQLSPNKGTGTARNIGLKHATGEYVAFLDVDDWMDMDGYYEMTSALDLSGSDIGVCSIFTEHGSYHLSKPRYQYRKSNTITGNFALRLLCKVEAQDSYISPRVGNKIFRRNFLQKNNICFPSYSVWEDDMFTFLAFYNVQKVDLVPHISEHYFQRESSAMHTFTREHIDSFIAVFSELKRLLTSENGKINCEVEFFALLDRSLNTMFDSLFSNEPCVVHQRQYICYLIEALLHIFSIQELLEHIEPQRLSRLWL